MINSFLSLDIVANDHHKLFLCTVLVLCWSVIYTVVNLSFNFKTLNKKKSDDTKNRIVSIAHGILTFWMAATQYLPYAIFK
jgi:hypothetical protein